MSVSNALRTVTVRMPEQLHTDLKRFAEKEDKSLNAICGEVLQALIDSELVRTSHKPPEATQDESAPTRHTTPVTNFTPKGF